MSKRPVCPKCELIALAALYATDLFTRYRSSLGQSDSALREQAADEGQQGSPEEPAPVATIDPCDPVRGDDWFDDDDDDDQGILIGPWDPEYSS